MTHIMFQWDHTDNEIIGAAKKIAYLMANSSKKLKTQGKKLKVSAKPNCGLSRIGRKKGCPIGLELYRFTSKVYIFGGTGIKTGCLTQI